MIRSILSSSSSSSCLSSLGGRRRSCHVRPVRAGVGSVVQAQSSNALASLGCLGVIPRPRRIAFVFPRDLVRVLFITPVRHSAIASIVGCFGLERVFGAQWITTAIGCNKLPVRGNMYGAQWCKSMSV